MTDTATLQSLIETAFEKRADINPRNITRELRIALDECLDLLDSGAARVAEPHEGGWRVNDWLKKAVLLYFRAHDNRLIEGGHTRFFDKVPLKYAAMDEAAIRASGVRVVPDAVVRKGAYIGPNTVLMPSFVNIGAWVGEGTMVDTWATVGSCAQIGRNVHLSGGVGIGGVLEPLQATPTIIEDDCFIGARSEIVEGVVVERGAVISMGGVHRPEHPDLRPRERPHHPRTGARRRRRRPGQPALQGRLALARLRDHRQEGRRSDARQDLHQRPVAISRLTDLQKLALIDADSLTP